MLKTAVLAGLVAGAAAVVPSTWCNSAPPSGWDVCNPALSLDARSADIVSRLSIADKIKALGTGTPALSSINLPQYNWWSEATHGISHTDNSAPTPWASNTILPITASCAFNRSLWHATGNQIGREARAFQNVGHADSTYWAPVINIVRDPRCVAPHAPVARTHGQALRYRLTPTHSLPNSRSYSSRSFSQLGPQHRVCGRGQVREDTQPSHPPTHPHS